MIYMVGAIAVVGWLYLGWLGSRILRADFIRTFGPLHGWDKTDEIDGRFLILLGGFNYVVTVLLVADWRAQDRVDWRVEDRVDWRVEDRVEKNKDFQSWFGS